MMQSNGLFLSCFTVYIVFLIALGYWVSRKQKSGEDFLLAGRQLPLLLILGTTVATMVGTGSSMGAVGFGYANGWAGALYGIGGALGILLLAWWFAPVREQNFTTMSEELAFYVGDKKILKNIVGIIIFLACIGWLGAHILGGGMYLAWVTGLDIHFAKIIVALGFSIYIVIGGYSAVVWTDSIQALVLFFGFILMAVFAIDTVGSWQALTDAQTSENLSLFGIQKVSILPAISLVAVIAVGVLATPSFRQRIYSAKNVSAVRRSFGISGLLYLGFSIIPAIVGMAAFALNPDIENRNFAFPYLAIEVLPISIGIIVLIAGLSATMSSASSDAIAAVAIALKDMYPMVKGQKLDEKLAIIFSRVAVLGVVGLALSFALISNDIIHYITSIIATVMSGLFTCAILGRFWQPYTWQGAIASLLAASITSTVILINSEVNNFFGNPILPAMFMAFLLGVITSLMTKIKE